MSWDAIILAGGRAERLDGTSKPDVLIGTTTLLERTVAAVRDAACIVIAGEAEVEGCITAHESEPFGGPVSGIAAALPFTTADRVLVVACDHPFIEATVPSLTTAHPGRDGVIAIDSAGRRQNLLTCLDRRTLTAAVAALDSPFDVSMRQLLAALDVREIVVDDRAAFDVDTWDDVEAARARDANQTRGGGR